MRHVQQLKDNEHLWESHGHCVKTCYDADCDGRINAKATDYAVYVSAYLIHRNWKSNDLYDHGKVALEAFKNPHKIWRALIAHDRLFNWARKNLEGFPESIKESQ